MKAKHFIAVISLAVLTACGTSTTNQVQSGVTTVDATGQLTANSTSASNSAIPTMTITESDWATKDLSTISSFVPLTMNVPKNAKMEKNGNGGVDIRVSDFYMITVSAMADGSIQEGKNDMKSLFVNNTTSYQNGKIVTDEPNGFIYTMQMKDEANGTKYQPETHFAYYVEKDGAIYQICDARPLDNFSVAGSAYSEDIAKKVYAIVKGSAKVK